MDIIFVIGMELCCISATYFLWKRIKYNKLRANALSRLEKLHKICTR